MDYIYSKLNNNLVDINRIKRIELFQCTDSSTSPVAGLEVGDYYLEVEVVDSDRFIYCSLHDLSRSLPNNLSYDQFNQRLNTITANDSFNGFMTVSELKTIISSYVNSTNIGFSAEYISNMLIEKATIEINGSEINILDKNSEVLSDTDLLKVSVISFITE